METEQRCCVVGLGYIGLPTAAVFADRGWKVIGADVDPHVVAVVNDGRVHIEEPGLAELLQRQVKRGRLQAALAPEPADVFIIAVPTPIHPDQRANLDYVEEAVHSLLPVLSPGNMVIVESTVPPRTMDDRVAPILTAAGWRIGEDLYLAHCPERVLPGRILHELSHNHRIVGGVDPVSTKKAARVYRTVVQGEVMETEAITAEMTKLMENTYRDVNIALANELVRVSDRLGIDAWEVIRLANQHPRVNLHQPGPGVGGHCLAVDPYFITEKAPDEALLIRTARKINSSMPAYVANWVKEMVKGRTAPKVALFGLAYKGNVDDIRESPALAVWEELSRDKELQVVVHDPFVEEEKVAIPLMEADEAMQDADCLVILTDHEPFKYLEGNRIAERMRTPWILDTKGILQTDHPQLVIQRLGTPRAVVSPVGSAH
ncbi:nucleotide sugar dehydrogenase [Desmospora profundinema]|uniref:UDP-N-acetyl-D-mannosaminuronic acid dehydrogenase n=1 Tax=Desmospora profundinema TaxID=1571184 RepID=A0ABU1ISR9_9BACL|nr:nucleotide sugar dehydrogenase [Desmospora profundinema]MDR6227493.1 UDP-N-acetyl-D-mannosaminuronic acid dehydrogenase [Desmospora profundinema]